jgi:hypothetical protein
MSATDLEKLRKQAMLLQIEPADSFGGAPRVRTLVNVLGRLQRSYEAFSLVEMAKQPVFRPLLARNPDLQRNLLRDLEWLVVDVSYRPFTVALVPNRNPSQLKLYTDEVEQWKESAFPTYRDIFLTANFDEPGYLRGIGDRYTDRERKSIFEPLFKAIGDGQAHTLHILDAKGKRRSTLAPPNAAARHVLVPPARPDKTPATTRTVLVAMEAPPDATLRTLRKPTAKTVKYFEVLEHDDYPYITDRLSDGGRQLRLRRLIKCYVEWEHRKQCYRILYEPFELEVEAATREQAEQAFNRAFIALFDEANGAPGVRKQRKSALALLPDLNALVMPPEEVAQLEAQEALSRESR